MLNYIFFILVGWLGVVNFASAAVSQVLPIQYWTTAQGTPVYFVQSNTIPILDVQVAFDAGSSRDGNQFGLAEITNNTIDDGTTHATADQIATRFDNVGAIENSSVERDMATLSLRTLTGEKTLEPALKTFIEIMSSPIFPEKEFKREQKQLISAIHQEQQSPGELADDIFNKTIYGSSPYGHPVIGTLSSMTTLTRDNLKNFYKKYYVARNAVISIVGAISRKDAETIASRISQSLPEGSHAPALPQAQPLQKNIYVHVPFPSTQTHIDMGEVSITPDDPDYFPMIVGNHILGGGILVSRLTNEIRETRGLAYVAQSEIEPLMNGGNFEISMQTRNERANDALQLAKDTLKKFIDEGPTEKEITAAKDNIISSFPLRFSNNATIARILTMIGFYHRPLNYLDTFQSKINAVTRAQIISAFKRHIDLQKMAIVTLGSITIKNPSDA